jgi:RING/Ubox like zinc-binding domain
MDDDDECPLCLDALDLTDRGFFPCPCGYQVCRFCWNHIMENLNALCPACRTPYAEQNYTFKPPDPSELAKQHKKKREKEREKKQQEASQRKHLTNVRVIQRNLVYMTNLPMSIAKEEMLRKKEYFGQYGKIIKIVVNKNNLYNVNHPQGMCMFQKPKSKKILEFFRR